LFIYTFHCSLLLNSCCCFVDSVFLRSVVVLLLTNSLHFVLVGTLLFVIVTPTFVLRFVAVEYDLPRFLTFSRSLLFVRSTWFVVDYRSLLPRCYVVVLLILFVVDLFVQ